MSNGKTEEFNGSRVGWLLRTYMNDLRDGTEWTRTGRSSDQRSHPRLERVKRVRVALLLPTALTRSSPSGYPALAD